MNFNLLRFWRSYDRTDFKISFSVKFAPDRLILRSRWSEITKNCFFQGQLDHRHLVYNVIREISDGRATDIRLMSVAHLTDVRRTCDGRLTDVRRTSGGRTSVGRATDVRRTSDRRTGDRRATDVRWTSTSDRRRRAPFSW